MKHLKIEQSTNSIEVVDPKVIDKLYNLVLFHPVGENLDSTSNLKGNLLCSHAYGDVVDYLTTNYKDLSISVTGGIYIRFEDNNVETICANNWGDGTGITSVQASVVNNFNNKFLNNSTITKFNELKYFINCTNITDYLFLNCTSLTSVDLSNTSILGNRVFYNCSSLTTVGDTSKLNTLGDLSFLNCTSLTTVGDLPNLKIALHAMFSNCTSLTGNLNTTSLVEVDDYAFYKTKVTSIDLSNITTISYGAFADCSNLNMDVYMPLLTKLAETKSSGTNERGIFNNSGITKIRSLGKIQYIPIGYPQYDRGHFAKCNNLTYVVLPSTLLSIGNLSFKQCPNLKTVISLATTPPSLGGTDVFNGSNASIKFFVPDNSLNTYKTATNWSNYASSIQYISTYLTQYSITEIPDKLFQGMDTITVMDCSNITKIGSYAFDGCSSLKTVDLNSACTTIGDESFRNCSSLESIGDINSVTTIGYSVFRNCKVLKTIELTNITSIGNGAFNTCPSLKYLKINASSVPTVGSDILYGSDICKIYVTDSLVDSYKSATNWSAYASRIFSLTQFAIDFPNG